MRYKGRMKTLLLPLVMCGFLAAPALAWDPLGHMIVGQTAYDHLTPAARQAVDASVAAFNSKNQTAYTFVTAGCWMDDIRGKTREYNTWHYIELPDNPEAEPFPVAWQVNALWGIRLCTDIIRGTRTHPGVDRDQALVMLTHMVGDIHQPLHTTSRANDAGGNKVVVPNIEDAKVAVFPKWRNLHYFWDGAYRRTVRDGKVVELFAEPPALAEDPVLGHNAAQPLARQHSTALVKTHSAENHPPDGDAEAWVRESHRTGFTEGYQKLPGGEAANPVELDAAYVDNAREITRQKLVQAGLRLAALLNTLYPDPGP